MTNNKKYVSDYPELLAEWDNDRNIGLLPSNVTAGSNKTVWWLCKKHRHSWQAVVKNRVNGAGCPFCSGFRILVGFNDLATLYPELVEEWDYTKNGDLKPTDISGGNSRKVWWLCKKHRHSNAYIGKMIVKTKGGTVKATFPVYLTIPDTHDLSAGYLEFDEDGERETFIYDSVERCILKYEDRRKGKAVIYRRYDPVLRTDEYFCRLSFIIPTEQELNCNADETEYNNLNHH